jgi:hypothetical protein
MSRERSPPELRHPLTRGGFGQRPPVDFLLYQLISFLGCSYAPP